ncbi:amino acid adenylation domain-containing protein [Streptomyces sp. ME19-01-6]|uniref:non-ribosomal peptide synthetase n=1 Tax=Streptomyces sp. ME19-01-6 TaxID=3028686 RepID=UPI0029A9B53E|nr:amino acid adenylation domain-containing protein [Streptomyces sp. ME19-01-6]MDX3228674.1 amino acid adenylation domain-containing protein [Streptomyces sp. ME19-01-6]
MAEHALGGAAETSLGPIQRAYLVGDQDGLELRSPARYYLACDVHVSGVEDIQPRLDRLVRGNPLLRLSVGHDLIPRPVAADAVVPVAVLEATERTFDTIDRDVRDEFSSDSFEFDAWPQLRITVVRSPRRARIHLVYALWLMDAASLNLFLRELVSPARLPPPPSNGAATPAPDAVGSRRRERDERYWRAVAPTLPEAAEVPLRPGWRQAGRAITHRMLHIDEATASAIADQARRHGLTVPMFFLTVYGALLGTVGGGRSHTITLVHSQRPVGAEQVLGNYGSPLPLAIPAAEGRTFVTLAREVQGRFMEQLLHSSLSGPDIARLADPSADRRRLQYPFAFTAAELDTKGEAKLGLRRDWDSLQLRVPQVLLDHQVGVESDGSFRLGFDWRTDAFDEGFVDDFIEQYARSVAQLAANETDWVRTGERTGPVDTDTGPRPADHSGVTLHQRVMRTAERTPDAPAVRDDDGVLTYAMLAAAASDVAERLVAAGAGVGDHVAVHVPRGRGQVVAILGALLAGCVFIPLDRGVPPGRLDRITRQAHLRFAVTGQEAGDADHWRRRGVYPLATATATATAAQGRRRPPSRGAPDVAYVIFTSGSTGEPKGVVIRHAAVLNTIDAVNGLIGLGPSDSVLSVSSIGFDLSVYDVFGPLLAGATVVMLSEDTARTPSAWSRTITENAVTIWNSAPALAALLAEEAGALPSVRAYLLSGDWIPLRLPSALQRISAGSQVISLGGATEGSIWSIYHRITTADGSGRSIPYGKPLPGQDILVLDAQRRACPNWHIGEICIAGAGVADGYLNDPDRTSHAFVDDPEYGWIYRTGDRGRRGPDGVVEFLGRADTQVKVNGYRVELGEIESLLNEMAHVRRSAACVSEDGGGVLAFVTLSPDAPAAWRERSIAALRDELPSYMVPYALIDIDEIPLTSSGKVDHRRLRAAVPTTGTPVESPEPRRKGLHVHEVEACWTEILGRAPGREGFFESGGGSLDAIRLLSLLRSRFGYDVPFGRFLATPTVTGLAELCGTERRSANTAVWSFTPRSVASPRGRVIVFPPVGGGVACYSGLIRSLPGDLDVHVLGFDRPIELPRHTVPTLDAVADVCLRRLAAEITDSGVPCVFVGWSFGGALAVEAARSAPYPMTQVVVLDTPVSAASRHCDDTDAVMLSEFVDDIRRVGGVAVSAADVSADPALHRRFEVYRQNKLLLRDWEPRPVGVPVVECRAGERPAEPDPDAWRRWAPAVRTVPLTGGHFDVFEAQNAHRVRDEIKGAFQ